MLKEKRNISKFNIIGFSVLSLICFGIGLGIIIEWINKSVIFVIMGIFFIALGLIAVYRIFVQPKFIHSSYKTAKTPKPQTMDKSEQYKPLVKYNEALDGDYTISERFRLLHRY